MLSACAGTPAADHSTSPSQSAQATCQQLDDAMNSYKEAQARQPRTQESTLANLEKMMDSLNMASQNTIDAELKASLVLYSSSFGKYVQVLKESKQSGQPNQAKFDAVTTDLSTAANRTNKLCKTWLTNK